MNKIRCLAHAMVLLLSPSLALPAESLIDIQAAAPTVGVDIRYATKDNFVGEALYPQSRCLLWTRAAESLAKVQRELEKRRLGLKVWDCYRPLAVQYKLWAKVPDERYVANPANGSRHNRGAAVDLTLVDALGRELPMPTAYDDFTEKAHRNFEDVTQEEKANRRLLEVVMSRHGFIGLDTEWWHFDYKGWQNYPVMDLPLERIPAIDEAGQLIVVGAKDWDQTAAKVYLFERSAKGWRRVKSMPAVLGRKGLGWGLGLHPQIDREPQKREGDLRSPAGVFAMVDAYGYDQRLPFDHRWPYAQATPDLICVDDPKSGYYNRVILKSGPQDWSSAEDMLRKDDLYRRLIIVEHNSNPPKPGRGSCIFFHIWKDKNSGTAGCTAFAQKDIEFIVEWLDPAKKPVVVQLPEKVYGEIAGIWNLPRF
ncbi:MAG: D-alanyl-D-alanine carboxypeptidase family protein [Elusimicrobia bacterium]|nr:D-alanyl-D-alanine carboxypeptidase family protein [Elusimicrobiota bacterium]